MILKTKRLDHVAIFASDLDRCISFYHEILGLKILPRPDFGFPGAWFSLGGKEELHIIVSEDEIRNRPNGHFALEVEGIEAFAKFAAEKGIPHRGPQSRPDGALQMHIEDPDGNTIELTSGLPK